VRNCIDGFVQTHELGFGPRRPATSSHCGSSALVETFQFAGSAVEPADGAAVSPAAAAAGAAGAGAGAGAASVTGIAGAGGFGAGASVHAVTAAAAAARSDAGKTGFERCLFCIRAVA
jgi:hypothetical protein